MTEYEHLFGPEIHLELQQIKLHDRRQVKTRVTPQSLLICAACESKLTGQPGSRLRLRRPVTAT